MKRLIDHDFDGRRKVPKLLRIRFTPLENSLKRLHDLYNDLYRAMYLDEKEQAFDTLNEMSQHNIFQDESVCESILHQAEECEFTHIEQIRNILQEHAHKQEETQQPIERMPSETQQPIERMFPSEDGIPDLITFCNLQDNVWVSQNDLVDSIKNYITRYESQIQQHWSKKVRGSNFSQMKKGQTKSLLCFLRRYLKEQDSALLCKRDKQKRVNGKNQSFYKYRVIRS